LLLNKNDYKENNPFWSEKIDTYKTPGIVCQGKLIRGFFEL